MSTPPVVHCGITEPELLIKAVLTFQVVQMANAAMVNTMASKEHTAAPYPPPSRVELTDIPVRQVKKEQMVAKMMQAWMP